MLFHFHFFTLAVGRLLPLSSLLAHCGSCAGSGSIKHTNPAGSWGQRSMNVTSAPGALSSEVLPRRWWSLLGEQSSVSDRSARAVFAL